MPNLDLVEKSELFRGLSPQVLGKVITFCQEVEFPRGATIIQEGDKAQYVYILKHGLVTLRIDAAPGKEKVMVTAIRDAGEIFGWSTLIDPYTYTSSAICLEPTKVIRVDGSELMRLMEENPSAGFIIMKNVSAVVASRLQKARTALMSALAPGLISHG